MDPQDFEDYITTIIGEAVGEGSHGMAAVAWAIKNRSIVRGMTIGEVVRQTGQFSGYYDPGKEAKLAQADPKIRAWAADIANQVLAGSIADPTGGADHFLTDGANPTWADVFRLTVETGGHRFFQSPQAARRLGTPQPAPPAAVAPVPAQQSPELLERRGVFLAPTPAVQSPSLLETRRMRPATYPSTGPSADAGLLPTSAMPPSSAALSAIDRAIGSGANAVWPTAGYPARDQPFSAGLSQALAFMPGADIAVGGAAAGQGNSAPLSFGPSSTYDAEGFVNENSWLIYDNAGATRNLPLSEKLIEALSFLPELGVTMEVFSGGQPAEGEGNRVGSTRHDHGNAADAFFYKDGRRLDWANPQDRPLFEEIVRRARIAGVTGIGAGNGYMWPGSMHIGFGEPGVWGRGGLGANAPAWLREAYFGAAPAPRPATMSPELARRRNPSLGAGPASQNPVAPTVTGRARGSDLADTLARYPIAGGIQQLPHFDAAYDSRLGAMRLTNVSQPVAGQSSGTAGPERPVPQVQSPELAAQRARPPLAQAQPDHWAAPAPVPAVQSPHLAALRARDQNLQMMLDARYPITGSAAGNIAQQRREQFDLRSRPNRAGLPSHNYVGGAPAGPLAAGPLFDTASIHMPVTTAPGGMQPVPMPPSARAMMARRRGQQDKQQAPRRPANAGLSGRQARGGSDSRYVLRSDGAFISESGGVYYDRHLR